MSDLTCTALQCENFYYCFYKQY